MSNWTKGPWVSTCNWVHAASGGSICSLSGAISRKKKEAEANANLIAAAPELYEALVEALEEISEISEHDMGEVYNNPRINAVLAKARGES